MQRVATTLTAAASPPACAACCFHSSLIDSLATLVSSSWSLHPLLSLCTQVERGSRGPGTLVSVQCEHICCTDQCVSISLRIARGDNVTVCRWGKRGGNVVLVGWCEDVTERTHKSVHLNAGHLLAVGLFLPHALHASLTLLLLL